MNEQAGNGPGMTPQEVNAHIDGLLADPNMPTEHKQYDRDYDNAQVDKVGMNVRRVSYGRGAIDRHLEGQDRLITARATEISSVDTETGASGVAEVTASTLKKSETGTEVGYSTDNPDVNGSATVERAFGDDGEYKHTFKNQDAAKALITALATKRATRAVQNSVERSKAA